MGKQLWYSDGITKYVARRLLRYAFNGFFFKLEVDEKRKCYNAWMFKEYEGEKINIHAIEHFKEHFYGIDFFLIDVNELEVI